jgi:hypothetical protein
VKEVQPQTVDHSLWSPFDMSDCPFCASRGDFMGKVFSGMKYVSSYCLLEIAPAEIHATIWDSQTDSVCISGARQREVIALLRFN